MKFESAAEIYRYYAVSGFESEEQKDSMRSLALLELGETEFNEFEKQIATEVDLGLFLSTPPLFVG